MSLCVCFIVSPIPYLLSPTPYSPSPIPRSVCRTLARLVSQAKHMLQPTATSTHLHSKHLGRYSHVKHVAPFTLTVSLSLSLRPSHITCLTVWRWCPTSATTFSCLINLPRPDLKGTSCEEIISLLDEDEDEDLVPRAEYHRCRQTAPNLQWTCSR